MKALMIIAIANTLGGNHEVVYPSMSDCFEAKAVVMAQPTIEAATCIPHAEVQSQREVISEMIGLWVNIVDQMERRAVTDPYLSEAEKEAHRLRHDQ
jgi:hypothetical protein